MNTQPSISTIWTQKAQYGLKSDKGPIIGLSQNMGEDYFPNIYSILLRE